MDEKRVLFEPIEKKRAFEEVADRIKELVFNGFLQSGDKLPSEGELARQYNVGRQTIREALRYLEISGFITTQKGGAGGVFIEDAVLNAIANSFVDATKMKKVTIEEVMEVRLEIEKLVLKNAIKNADEMDIKSLEEIILTTKKKIEANVDSSFENIIFHKFLAKASKNQVLIIMVDLIMAVIGDFMKKYEVEFDKTKPRVTEHKEIIDAIINKNEDKASKVLEKHVRVVKNMIRKMPKDLDEDQK